MGLKASIGVISSKLRLLMLLKNVCQNNKLENLNLGNMDKTSKSKQIKDFTEKCRKLQGRFREEIYQTMGIGPSGKPQINMITNGEKTGKNFVNDFAFQYAKYRVEHKEKNETFGVDRLFNNLLSSQPMAFNLFCPFIEMLEKGKMKEVSSIFQAIFPDKGIKEVVEVGLEFLHADIKNYLNDKTAMDVIIRYIDNDGKRSFIAIETKYTDVLGANSPSNTKLHKEWIKRLGVFREESEELLLNDEKPISQIYRNFLLSECYGIMEGANKYYSVVLSPAHHPTTEEEVDSLKNELKPEYKNKISSISLEDFVEQTMKRCPQSELAVFYYFYNRYLDFSKIE